MQSSNRKITGDKFVITLPQPWREANGLVPGNYVEALFRETGDSGPMVIVPHGLELSDLQNGLISALLDGPSPEKAKELAEKLGAVATQLNQMAEAAIKVATEAANAEKALENIPPA